MSPFLARQLRRVCYAQDLPDLLHRIVSYPSLRPARCPFALLLRIPFSPPLPLLLASDDPPARRPPRRPLGRCSSLVARSSQSAPLRASTIICLHSPRPARVSHPSRLSLAWCRCVEASLVARESEKDQKGQDLRCALACQRASEGQNRIEQCFAAATTHWSRTIVT